jgi:hypothetical protein
MKLWNTFYISDKHILIPLSILFQVIAVLINTQNA